MALGFLGALYRTRFWKKSLRDYFFKQGVQVIKLRI